MPYPLLLHEEAHEEYITAYLWYEEKQAGLGDKFMYFVDKALQQISEHPEYYGKRHAHYRAVKVPNFPFMIVYEVLKLKGFIHVAAIYHASRHPKRKYRKPK